ncbi:alkylated DNA repair protein alkB homolog 8 [Cloeon dipterum]|uniref:alkylated DNA repair protein alkB homolog 8 n=1 Tax=Cloeon dipterum TaxID=197152 RepID=UPI00321FF2E5
MNCKGAYKSKISRKLRKYSNILKEAHNVEISETDTEFLAICNAGLTTGLSREIIMEALDETHVAALKDIHFVENTSVTFLTCVNAGFAMSVLKALNEDMHCDFFVVFVKNIPEFALHSEASLPAGLILLENFVSPEEEIALLKSVDWTSATPEQGQSLKHRQVRHFGYQFEYGSNNVNPEKPLDAKIPSVCSPVFDRVVQREITAWVPDQLTVNQYEPGQGIPPHIDTHSAFEDPILSLSLESDVVMEFRKSGVVVPVLLPRRSLLVMSGESRYAWTHGINPRKSDVVNCPDGKLSLVQRKRRTSFTFRRLLRRACTCTFSQFCDSQKENDVLSRENISNNCNETASKLENLHVHQVYEEIAGHFSETRHKPWPNVLSFVNKQVPGSVILDVGCGNGKYLGLNKQSFQVGCDMSQHLLKICREREFETFLSNCLALPFKDNSVDCCISIAVIHHLSTEDRRLKAISEMVRVLAPGGEALIYVWAKNQERDQQKSSYLKQCNNKPSEEKPAPISPFSLPVHTNRTQFCHSDLLVPWKLKQKGLKNSGLDSRESEEVYFRYYHMFEEGELELLCNRLNNASVERSYYDQGNWCVVLKKVL